MMTASLCCRTSRSQDQVIHSSVLGRILTLFLKDAGSVSLSSIGPSPPAASTRLTWSRRSVAKADGWRRGPGRGGAHWPENPLSPAFWSPVSILDSPVFRDNFL